MFRGGGPRWPTPRRMGELVVPASNPPANRVLLGRLAADTTEARIIGLLLGKDRGTPALAAPPNYGVLVVGASRSGKTSSLLVPAVRRWEGPVIATSTRSDVVANSKRVREAMGWPTLIYNPRNLGGFGSNTWSPLLTATGEQAWLGALRMASTMIEAAGVAEYGANREQAFWDGAADRYLAPILLAAATYGTSMEPVMRWVNSELDARDEMPARLAAYPRALAQAESVWALEHKVRSSVYATLQVALKGYEDPYVLRTCLPTQPDGLTDITPDTVLGTPSAPGATLYIISPPTGRKHYAPLFSALVTSLFDAAFARSEEGALSRPPLVALDEAANIVPIRDLPGISSMTAGAGIQLITVLQDLAQAKLNWGESLWTLMTNHYGGRLILGGTVEPTMLSWAGEMLGKVDRERRAVSREGIWGRRTTTVSPERQEAATAAEIRTMPMGTALLVAGSYPTARVTLDRWWAVRPVG